MKCLLIAYICLTAAVSAQSAADLPICSLDCFASAVAKTSCVATDYVCQCSTTNAATIKQSVTSCLSQSSCSLADLQKIQSWSSTFCPSVLASASAASLQPASSTSRSLTPDLIIPTTSSSISLSSTSSQPTTLSTPSTSGPDAVTPTFGAGTAGTSWGNLPSTTSKANRGPAFAAVSVVLLVMAALVIAFRFFARLYTHSMRKIIRGLGADEWFALISLLITAGVTADIIVGNSYGMGRHLSPQDTGADLIAILKLVYVFIILITASFSTLKFSILFLYLRMTPERSHHIIIYICMGIVAAHTTAAIFGEIFQCTPISAYWSLGNPLQSKQCMNILAFHTFNSAWSMFEDIVLWFLPIPVIWNLRVPLARKSGLFILIAISFIAVIVSVVRMAVLVVWVRSADISWNYPLVPFLANMEACVALMTSSVPAIYPLFRKSPPKEDWSNPAPPPAIEVEKEWDSQNSQTSQSNTAVASTANTDRSSKRWSFLSRPSMQLKVKGHEGEEHNHEPRHMTTIQSEGPRTELKSFGMEEEGGGRDIIPGLAKVG